MKWFILRISSFFYIFQKLKLLDVVPRTLFFYLFFFHLSLFYIFLTLNFLKKKKKIELSKKKKNTKERKLNYKFIQQNFSEYNFSHIWIDWKNSLQKCFFIVYFIQLKVIFYIAIIYKRKLLYCLLFKRKKRLQFFFQNFFKKNSINLYKQHSTQFCKIIKISKSKHRRGFSGVQLDLGLNSVTFEQDDILPTFSIKYYNTFQYSENRQNFKVKKKKTQSLKLNKKFNFLFVYRLPTLVVHFSFLPSRYGTEDTKEVFLCYPFDKFANSVDFTKYLNVQNILTQNLFFVRFYNTIFFQVFFSLLFLNRMEKCFFFIKELAKKYKIFPKELKKQNSQFFRNLLIEGFYLYMLNKHFFVFKNFYNYGKKQHPKKLDSFRNKLTLAISQRQPFFSKIQNYHTKSRKAFYQFFYKIDKKIIDNQIFDLTFFQTFFSNIFIYDLSFYNQKFLAFFPKIDFNYWQKMMWRRYESHHLQSYIISKNKIDLSFKYGLKKKKKRWSDDKQKLHFRFENRKSRNCYQNNKLRKGSSRYLKNKNVYKLNRLKKNISIKKDLFLFYFLQMKSNFFTKSLKTFLDIQYNKILQRQAEHKMIRRINTIIKQKFFFLYSRKKKKNPFCKTQKCSVVLGQSKKKIDVSNTSKKKKKMALTGISNITSFFRNLFSNKKKSAAILESKATANKVTNYIPDWINNLTNFKKKAFAGTLVNWVFIEEVLWHCKKEEKFFFLYKSKKILRDTLNPTGTFFIIDKNKKKIKFLIYKIAEIEVDSLILKNFSFQSDELEKKEKVATFPLYNEIDNSRFRHRYHNQQNLFFYNIERSLFFYFFLSIEWMARTTGFQSLYIRTKTYFSDIHFFFKTLTRILSIYKAKTDSFFYFQFLDCCRMLNNTNRKQISSFLKNNKKSHVLTQQHSYNSKKKMVYTKNHKCLRYSLIPHQLQINYITIEPFKKDFLFWLFHFKNRYCHYQISHWLQTGQNKKKFLTPKNRLKDRANMLFKKRSFFSFFTLFKKPFFMSFYRGVRTLLKNFPPLIFKNLYQLQLDSFWISIIIQFIKMSSVSYRLREHRCLQLTRAVQNSFYNRKMLFNRIHQFIVILIIPVEYSHTHFFSIQSYKIGILSTRIIFPQQYSIVSKILYFCGFNIFQYFTTYINESVAKYSNKSLADKKKKKKHCASKTECNFHSSEVRMDFIIRVRRAGQIVPAYSNTRFHIQELRKTIQKFKAKSQKFLIQKLSPIIRSWCSYYCQTPNKKVFYLCDFITLKMLWRWACRRHKKKKKNWIKKKYFKKLNGKNWVFCFEEKKKINDANLILSEKNQLINVYEIFFICLPTHYDRGFFIQKNFLNKWFI